MIDIPSAFLPAGAAPLPTSPTSFRSRYQLSSLPLAFLMLKLTMALAFSTASLRSAASALRVALIASNAAEEGKASESDVRRLGKGKGKG